MGGGWLIEAAADSVSGVGFLLHESGTFGSLRHGLHFWFPILNDKLRVVHHSIHVLVTLYPSPGRIAPAPRPRPCSPKRHRSERRELSTKTTKKYRSRIDTFSGWGETPTTLTRTSRGRNFLLVIFSSFFLLLVVVVGFGSSFPHAKTKTNSRRRRHVPARVPSHRSNQREMHLSTWWTSCAWIGLWTWMASVARGMLQPCDTTTLVQPVR